jgi:hypothetical protein
MIPGLETSGEKNMSTSKKRAKATGHVKFKDLNAKKNPKGGLQKENNSASPVLWSAVTTGGSIVIPSLPASAVITSINLKI